MQSCMRTSPFKIQARTNPNIWGSSLFLCFCMAHLSDLWKVKSMAAGSGSDRQNYMTQLSEKKKKTSQKGQCRVMSAQL